MKKTLCLLAASLSITVSAQAFASEELRQALVSTYDSNPRIKSQREALRSLDESVNQALSNFRPTASVTYEYGRQRTSFDGSDYNYGNAETRQLVVEQPIFRGGGTISEYSSARNSVLAGRAELLATEQGVFLDAVQAYMDVVQNQSVLELSRNNVDVLAQQLQASQDRFDVGEVTRTDVAQSESRLARAQSDAIQAEGDLASAIAQFERVVGFIPENRMPLPDMLAPLPETLEQAIEIAMESNPSYYVSKYRHEAAEDNVNVNIAPIMPQVSLVGSMSRDDGAGVLGTSKFNSDEVKVRVRIPIYQSGSEYSRVREAKDRARQRKYELQDTKEAIREGVTQAWENWQTSLSTIRAQEEEIRAAEIALEGVREENQYGSRTVLDVLDAEQELFIARVNLVRAQRERVVSAYNLLSVLGYLTADKMALDTPLYNPEEHYDDVKFQFIGF